MCTLRSIVYSLSIRSVKYTVASRQNIKNDSFLLLNQREIECNKVQQTSCNNNLRQKVNSITIKLVIPSVISSRFQNFVKVKCFLNYILYTYYYLSFQGNRVLYTPREAATESFVHGIVYL